jgi:sec-independent protein translocase protein TatC
MEESVSQVVVQAEDGEAPAAWTPERLTPLLESLRSTLLWVAAAAALFSVGGFYGARPVLGYLVALTRVELVAYGIPETFFAFLSLSLCVGVLGTVPLALYLVLAALPPLFPAFSRRAMWLFWALATVLFYAGAMFCLEISLPYGVQFLLSYAGPRIAAYVSVRKFIGFCALLVFGFGLIFELPLAMTLLGRIGVVRVERLAASRRYAILVITIVAAVLTPTPDIFNLALMAVPLYLLFEMGLLGMRLWKAPTPRR